MYDVAATLNPLVGNANVCSPLDGFPRSKESVCTPRDTGVAQAVNSAEILDAITPIGSAQVAVTKKEKGTGPLLPWYLVSYSASLFNSCMKKTAH